MIKFAYAITACIAVLIALLTLAPLDVPAAPGGDKLHHFLAFACLCLPLALTHPKALFWFVPCALLFGASIEIIQPLVNRNGELADFFADAVGVIIGVISGLLLGITVMKQRKFN